MSRDLHLLSAAALLGALTTGAASAQFSDNFDSYANGTALQGVNGWKGWDNTAAAAGTVGNAQALSAPNSIAVGPTTDAVNEMGSPTEGCWRFSANTYVPAGLTGDQYLILLNTYNDGGPYNWSVELKLSGATGMIVDDFDAAWPGAPIPFDCWFGFQIDIDLDNDLCTTRIDLNCDGVYDDDGADNVAGTADDELISAGQSWANRGSGGGANAIGALDLFSSGASTIYWDNVELAECTSFSDDFDDYPNGTQLQGVNGWKGWANTAAAAGVVDNTQSLSGPNSVAIGPSGDAVNDLGAPTTGCWRFSTNTFVPSGLTGDQYLILLNTYADAGPNNWSYQIKMSGATGMITDDFDAAWPGAPIPFDCWFGYQIDIDLDNDVTSLRIDLNCDGVYDDDGADNVAGTADDELISSGQSWANRGSGAGANAIGAVDLFSNGASTIYYDNVSLESCGTFADDFDAYPNGTQLQGVNGWKGWANTPAAAGVVDNTQSLSGPNSIAIGPSGDAVNEMTGPTMGCWRLSASTYVPTGLTGDQYFIVLNTYDDAGPNNWSIQLKISGATGMITDDFDAAWPGAPIPFDCWFGFQVDADLDNDLCSIRIDLNCDGAYDDDGADNVAGTADDELISSGQSWSNRGSGGGALEVAAVDLFSNGASTIYWDDVLLEPCPEPSFVATSYCGPAVPNSTGNSATITATGEQSPGAADLTFHANDVPMNSFGVFSMGTAADNVPMAGGSTGTLCLGGTIERGVGLQILFSGASNSVSIAADVNNITPGGTAVMPGDTRYFQYWFRDNGSTSNFTDGLMVTFL